MNFLRQLFLKDETKEALGILSEIGRSIPEKNHLGWYHVVDLTERYFDKNEAKILKTIREEGITPRIAVYRTLYHICRRSLSLGEHHTYPGVLDLHGHQILEVFKFILNEMVKYQDIHPDALVAILQDVNKQIKAAG